MYTDSGAAVNLKNSVCSRMTAATIRQAQLRTCTQRGARFTATAAALPVAIISFLSAVETPGALKSFTAPRISAAAAKMSPFHELFITQQAGSVIFIAQQLCRGPANAHQFCRTSEHPFEATRAQ